MEYARIYCPQVAVVDFGGPGGNGMEVAARVREVSPKTAVIISLKVHRAKARSMLPRGELVNLIAQQYVRTSTQPVPAHAG